MTSHCAQVDRDDLAQEVKCYAITVYDSVQNEADSTGRTIGGDMPSHLLKIVVKGGGEGQGTGIFVSFASTHVSFQLGI